MLLSTPDLDRCHVTSRHDSTYCRWFLTRPASNERKAFFHPMDVAPKAGALQSARPASCVRAVATNQPTTPHVHAVLPPHTSIVSNNIEIDPGCASQPATHASTHLVARNCEKTAGAGKFALPWPGDGVGFKGGWLQCHGDTRAVPSSRSVLLYALAPADAGLQLVVFLPLYELGHAASCFPGCMDERIWPPDTARTARVMLSLGNYPSGT